MPVYIVELWIGQRWAGYPIEAAFQTAAAAQWWIDHVADKADGWRYNTKRLPVFSLSEAQEFWP